MTENKLKIHSLDLSSMDNQPLQESKSFPRAKTAICVLTTFLFAESKVMAENIVLKAELENLKSELENTKNGMHR